MVMSVACGWKHGAWFFGIGPVVPVVAVAPGLSVVPPKVTRRRDGKSLVARARVRPMLLELPPIPAHRKPASCAVFG